MSCAVSQDHVGFCGVLSYYFSPIDVHFSWHAGQAVLTVGRGQPHLPSGHHSTSKGVMNQSILPVKICLVDGSNSSHV